MKRGEHVNFDTLFDVAAESMILYDPADRESLDGLVTAFCVIRDQFGEIPDDHPAVVALRLARLLRDGDESVISEIEKAYGEARSLAEKRDAATPEAREAASAPKAKPTSKKPAEKPAAPSAMPLAGDEELLRDFGTRAVEHMDDADEGLLALESDPEDSDSIDAVFRAFHTIKGMAGFLALDEISALAHESESLLAGVRGGSAPADSDLTQALFSAVDRMRALVMDASGVGKVTPSAEGPAKGASTEQAVAASAAREGTVRVEEARLDALLDTIGEMVIAESMVSASVKSGVDVVMLESRVDRLDKISRELQQMATALRMVSLKMTFARMGRVVRDVAMKAGKKVEFVVTGEDTEIDKTVAERLSDPLIHALRNAVDHGIESPAQRRAAGKPEAGRVELNAFHSGGAIHVEITDDGKGIDVEKIRSRACDLGLVEEDAALSEQHLYDMLFEPGFSTADEVTDVSGRGVGMDVVKRTVEELRGRVSLNSTPGEGTSLSVRLPVTLAIIDGMVVRIGGERYVIPVLSIERSVRPKSDELSRVQQRGMMLRNDDRLIPILPLHEILEVDGAEPDPTQAVVVIISEGGVSAGLLACELLGQQQTVIKPLGEGLPEHAGVAGAAIMPDGEVGLILDAAGLVRLANGDRSE